MSNIEVTDVLGKPFKFLSDNFKRLPRWAQTLAYFIFLAYIIVLTIFMLQGHFLYKGWVLIGDKDAENHLPAKNMTVHFKEADVRVVTSERGRISLPINIISYYLDHGAPEKLKLLVENSPGNLVSVDAKLSGTYQRYIEIFVPESRGEEISAIGSNTTQTAINWHFRGLISAAHASQLSDHSDAVLGIKSITIAANSIHQIGKRPIVLRFENVHGKSVLKTINPAVNVKFGVAVVPGIKNVIGGGWYLDFKMAYDSKKGSDFKINVVDQNTELRIVRLIIPAADIGKNHIVVSDKEGKIKVTLETLRPYELIVFEKLDSGERRARVGQAADNARIWHRFVKSKVDIDARTNAIFLGYDVPFSIARSFLRELFGVWPDLELRRIIYNIRQPGRGNIIQLGSSKAGQKCTTIESKTVNKMIVGSSYSDWNNLLSDCQINLGARLTIKMISPSNNFKDRHVALEKCYENAESAKKDAGMLWRKKLKYNIGVGYLDKAGEWLCGNIEEGSKNNYLVVLGNYLTDHEAFMIYQRGIDDKELPYPPMVISYRSDLPSKIEYKYGSPQEEGKGK